MSSLPHLLPYVLFILLGVLGANLPAPWGSAMEPIRALAVLGTVAWFYRRGAYPELAKAQAKVPRATALSIAAGVAVGLLWPVLSAAVPTLGEMGRGGFDASACGAAWAPVLLGGRLVASIVAVPFAEELLVRSLLPRWTDAGSGDWRDVPVGKFTALSAAVSIGFFTLTHPEWLAALVKTGRLRDLVISHAVANAVLDAYVLLSGETMLW
jgi:CAAX prenyl protease-like protein